MSKKVEFSDILFMPLGCKDGVSTFLSRQSQQCDGKAKSDDAPQPCKDSSNASSKVIPEKSTMNSLSCDETQNPTTMPEYSCSYSSYESCDCDDYNLCFGPSTIINSETLYSPIVEETEVLINDFAAKDFLHSTEIPTEYCSPPKSREDDDCFDVRRLSVRLGDLTAELKQFQRRLMMIDNQLQFVKIQNQQLRDEVGKISFCTFKQVKDFDEAAMELDICRDRTMELEEKMQWLGEKVEGFYERTDDIMRAQEAAMVELHVRSQECNNLSQVLKCQIKTFKKKNDKLEALLKKHKADQEAETPYSVTSRPSGKGNESKRRRERMPCNEEKMGNALNTNNAKDSMKKYALKGTVRFSHNESYQPQECQENLMAKEAILSKAFTQNNEESVESKHCSYDLAIKENFNDDLLKGKNEPLVKEFINPEAKVIVDDNQEGFRSFYNSVKWLTIQTLLIFTDVRPSGFHF